MTGIKWGGLAMVALLLAACGDDDAKKTSKSDSGTPGGWQAAVGADGTFAQTFDSVTWSTRTLTPHDLFAVTCVGNMDGWAVGENGFVGRTRDGGETWQQQNAGTSLALRTVHFVHDHHHATSAYTGVTAGDSGVMALSTNGGEVWTPITTGVKVALRGAASAMNADLIVVVGDSGTVLRTTDLGKTWHTQTLPGAADLRAVAVAPNGTLVLTVDSKGQIWGSKDLGQSFSLEATAKNALNGVALAADVSKALVAGDAGTALRRDAAGKWTETETGSKARLNAAMITHDGAREYLAGEGGALLGTSHLGATWDAPALGTTAALYGLEDLDPN